MDKTMKPTEKVEVINPGQVLQGNLLFFVPDSEQERYRQFLRTGMEPERAAFFCGIGSGRIDGDAEVDFSNVNPAFKSAPLLP